MSTLPPGSEHWTPEQWRAHLSAQPAHPARMNPRRSWAHRTWIRLLVRLGIGALTVAALTLTPLAQAAGGDGGGGSWPDGYKVTHRADTGYDPAIKTICYDLAFNIKEGRHCDETTRIYIRKGEELWCLRRTETFRRHYIKWMDATGWHTPHRGCDGVLRKD